MAIWSSGAGNNGIWAPDPLYGGIWASDMQRAISRAFITDNGGTTLLNASTGYINPNVTFSRASNGMVCDQDGNWTWTSLPYRRSYDVQTKEWGYLFEPQRTNLIPNTDTSRNPNATTGLPDGWGWQTLGSFPGIQASVVGRGAIGALSYIDIKFAGTATSGSGWLSLGLASGGISVTPGAYKLSLYAQLISGTHGKPFGLATAGSGLTGGNYAIQSSQLATMTRVDADLTCTTAGTAYPIFGSNVATGDTLDFTIRLMQPQLETGAVATSPIATSGAQVTVAADVCMYANNVLTDTAGTVLWRSSIQNDSVDGRVLWNRANKGFCVKSGGGAAMFDGANNPTSNKASTLDTSIASYGGSETTALISGGVESVFPFSGSMSVTQPWSLGVNPLGMDNVFSGYINHLSVFPTQLVAGKRATAASFTKF